MNVLEKIIKVSLDSIHTNRKEEYSIYTYKHSGLGNNPNTRAGVA